MKRFWNVYRWAMDMKLFGGIYFASLLFFECLVRALAGDWTVSTWTVIEMTVAGFGFSIVQAFCLPVGNTYDRDKLMRRTALWAAAGNGFFVGGTALCGWFVRPMPAVGWLCVVLMVNLGLFATWLGIQIAYRFDTAHLNRNLQQFQQGNPPVGRS